MNFTTASFTPASTRAQIVMAQLADVGDRALSVQSPSSLVVGERDARGRFTNGCNPGPGRPRKRVQRYFVSPLNLFQRCLDLDDSKNAWNSVVRRLGPRAARVFLHDLEAEKGPVSFRHVALEI